MDHAPPLQKFHQNLFITFGDILLTKMITHTDRQKDTHTHTRAVHTGLTSRAPGGNAADK